MELDTDGTYSDLILASLDDLSTNNDACNGAPQQLANGLYRLSELSAIVALELDKSGIFKDVISTSLDTLSANDKTCTGAPQQAVNGAYRCVELMAVMAYSKA